MNGISFIPSRGKKKKTHEPSDVEYTEGAPLDAVLESEPVAGAGELPVRKEPKPKKKKETEKQPEKKEHQAPEPPKEKNESSFAAWRRKRHEEKERKEAEERAKKQARKKAKKMHEAEEAPAAPAPPSPNLAEDYTTPQQGLGEHTAPVHEPEKAAADLLQAQAVPADLGEHEAPAAVADDSPDLTEPRVGVEGAAVSGVHMPPPADNKKKKKKKRKGEEEDATLTVNLIPVEVREDIIVKNRYRELVASAFMFAFIVLAIYGGLVWYGQRLDTDIQVTQEQVLEIEQQIAQYRSLQIDAQELSSELKRVEEVVNNRIYWTPFLELVEDLTLPTVYYTDMNGTAASGLFTFSAVTSDYAYINPQKEIFEQSPFVQSVNVTSASKRVDTIAGELAAATAPETATETATGATAEGGEGEPGEGQPEVVFTLSVQFDPLIFAHPRTAYGNAD